MQDFRAMPEDERLEYELSEQPYLFAGCVVQ